MSGRLEFESEARRIQGKCGKTFGTLRGPGFRPMLGQNEEHTDHDRVGGRPGGPGADAW